MSMRLKVALGLAVWTLACGRGGEPEGQIDVIDSAAAQKTAVAALQAGMSKDEVRNKLGEPRIRVTMDGGLERWTYYSYDAQGRIAAKTMIIFGDDGTIVEISDTSS
ncbi:MAG TPA: outer membrane protein assembly factor BamE [Gemmatimonadota bacterium]|jgi:YD repeat-containing protein|nr:outer membrane protein assembly factor BamE [Gemmatimonadota bacterium]